MKFIIQEELLKLNKEELKEIKRECERLIFLSKPMKFTK